MIEIKEKKIMLGDKEAYIRFGEYAHQANGSVTLQCGDTIVHSVVTMGEENPDLDYGTVQSANTSAEFISRVILKQKKKHSK